jgi:SAM-dependent methyltransferase
MITSRFLRQVLLLLCLLVIAGCANMGYYPAYNQPGKDVVWWPTSTGVGDTMLDMAKVTPEDYVIDLGSGDGRLVISAAKRGIRALGIEYNPDLVAMSKANAVKEGVSDKADFIQGDIFESDFSEGTVIMMFLSPAINLKLRPKLLNLKPGTRVVTNTFMMGEWPPDDKIVVDEREGCTAYCTANLWIVPAKVEGIWRLPQGELTLKQSFQTFTGTLKSDAATVAVTDGTLRGDVIRFSAGSVNYSGRVSGSTMQGTSTSGGGTTGGSPIPWNATRNP